MRRTFGVEEELLFVDRQTGAPVPVAPEVLALAERDGVARDAAVAEMHEEMLELVSRPHASLRALGADVRRARRMADRWAGRVGARAVALGTSPFPSNPHPSPGPRYRAIVERYGATSLRCMTCGLHVHVSVGSPEEGVAILDRIRIWLPVIRALAANSPFHDGIDTGYASYRFLQWSQWPSSGPSEVFGSLDAYQVSIDALMRTGALLDEGMLYPDVRLSRLFPTIEVRVADVPLLASATVTIAGLIRGLVATAAASAARGEPAPALGADALRLASWTASLEGLDGQLVHPVRGEPAPAAEVVGALLAEAAPGLLEHGDLEVVTAGVQQILRDGNGAAIQRRAAEASGSLLGAVFAGAPRSRASSSTRPTAGVA
ncbi:carboxylate-amine ligase [Agromyces aerolatus]|uniref:carboxylate-amine ligase n=1 Tax=Agromyces sp. LY-1074 TaxID=3074080 RepID=UPI0028638080|nr:MULTISPECIES: glutamate--cysteine ligase [unclassified Agromyces]MDR5698964.1 glutamate--cysteine ligase [Agromyces sp. LY-1074]MDR5705258.1 glutamate--cysteine ligase [Agromyces sp. LY-1358]